MGKNFLIIFLGLVLIGGGYLYWKTQMHSPYGSLNSRCLEGHAGSCLQVALLISREAEPDPLEIIRYYELACEKGDPQACLNAIGSLRGFPSEARDPSQRMKALIGHVQSYCDKNGTAIVCFEAGRVIKNILANTTLAQNYFQKACQKGHKFACKELEQY